MEHRLKDIAFDVQNHIAHRNSLLYLPAGLRQAARGAHICETRLFEYRFQRFTVFP